MLHMLGLRLDRNWLIYSVLLLCGVLGKLYIKQDRKKAEAVYTQLLDRNPENGAYYQGLEATVQPGNYGFIDHLWNFRMCYFVYDLKLAVQQFPLIRLSQSGIQNPKLQCKSTKSFTTHLS